MTRRRFVKGIAAGTVLMSSGMISRFSFANSKSPGLSGVEFDLEIPLMSVNFTEKDRTATVVNGLLPGQSVVVK